ncbi:MAG: hypothetical protein ACE5IK_08945 [Acidobacteriota bacterium]
MTRATAWICLLAAALSLLFVAPSRAQQAGEDLSPVGDPLFDPNSLSGEMRVWYDRMWESIEASRATVDARSSSRDLYLLGRYVNDYTTALIFALRATGDLRFLDRAAEIWENARATLADEWCDGTTDGYVNWVWLINPDVTSEYCKDTHHMDEAMAHGPVALLAYTLDRNRDLDPAYGEKADFWVSYLETQFLAKWTARAGDPVAAWETGAGFYKRFTHPRANQLRVAYYLHKLTGKPFYLERAGAIDSDLASHLEVNPSVSTALQWKHQVAGTDEGYQKVQYAHYFMNVAMEMNLEGFGSDADAATMAKFASTFRDVVLKPASSMTERVDGTGSVGRKLYGHSGLGRWDPTHMILDRAEAAYRPGSTGVNLAGAAMMAVSNRTGAPPPPDPDPGPDTTPPTSPTNLRRLDRLGT